MATQYPSKIDNNTTLPEVVDLATIYSAEVYNRLRNAIIAIENELGTSPASVYTTVKNRFNLLENDIGNLQIITLDKDLGGTLALPKVIGLQGIPISSTAPTTNQALVFNGTSWAPASLASAGGSLGITIAGDLEGSTLTQTVIKINGTTISTSGGALTTDHVLKITGASTADYGFITNANIDASALIEVNKLASSNNGYVLSVVSGSPAWVAQTPLQYEISLASGLQSTTATSFVRAGGRQIDISVFPATVGALTRTVIFSADIDMTAGATSVEVQLYDVTNSVAVTSTNLTSSSTTNIRIASGSLTVGSFAGNIRSDVPSQYELQFKMNGGGGSDAVFLTNSKLVITYA